MHNDLSLVFVGRAIIRPMYDYIRHDVSSVQQVVPFQRTIGMPLMPISKPMHDRWLHVRHVCINQVHVAREIEILLTLTLEKVLTIYVLISRAVVFDEVLTGRSYFAELEVS
jgi:hypothetical protein